MSRRFFSYSRSAMKIIPHACIFAVIAIVLTYAQEQKLTIAVNDLQAKGLQQSDAEVISDRLRSELLRLGMFRVLEREEMTKILKEQGFQTSGACTEQTCLVEVGQMLGVQRMAAGTVGKVGSMYTINIRMIDVATGEILYSSIVDCKCTVDQLLVKSTVEIAKKFSDYAQASALKIDSSTIRKFALLKVDTKPTGATATLDGGTAKTTPCSWDSLKTGIHSLNLGLKDFASSTREIKLAAGDTSVIFIELKKELDAKSEKNKHRLHWQITTGIATVVCAGAGIGFDLLMQDKIKTNNTLKNDYNANPSAYNFTTESANYQANYNDAKNYSLYRNICYGLACVGAAGFALTFVF
jgi:TolB-like protein